METDPIVRLKTGEEVKLSEVRYINKILLLLRDKPDVLHAAVVLSRDIEAQVSGSLIHEIIKTVGLKDFMENPRKRAIIAAMAEGEDSDLKLVDPILKE